MKIIKLVVSCFLLYFAYNGMLAGVPSAVQPVRYDGPYSELNSLAQKMEPSDRKGLSEALSAASKMLADDKSGMVKNTENLQEFILGTISYGYSSFSVKQYEDVAAFIEEELEGALGPTVRPVDAGSRNKVSNTMSELSRAVQ